MNDGYGDDDEAWRTFCQVLADSDVEVFGITDYFSLRTFFKCRELFGKLHPDIKRTFFPNIELRLPESVNKDAEPVELHIVLRHDLTEKDGETLLRSLQSAVKEDGRNRKLTCWELETSAQVEAATVTRENVKEALELTFGAGQEDDPQDYMLIVPANHGGLRSELAEVRKSELADGIDEWVDGVFGNEGNVLHFLDPDRARTGNRKLPPHPVFAGSDAHSLDQLKAWLGREVREEGVQKSVTWIKADPNFEGLLQTKAEPQGRVRLRAAKPDPKDPYRYLEKVSFGENADFPEEIGLNQNLVAVIGPRSSGKSSLLAHIAHVIDPSYTEEQQQEIQSHLKPHQLGPAPGVSWADVADLDVEVEWAEPSTVEGRVIYVPQNALYEISQKPDEITERIEPALRQMDPDFDVALRQMSSVVEAANEEITLGVGDWFRIAASIEAAGEELRDRGDKEAIAARREELGREIAAKREASALSEEEAGLYESVMDELSAIEARLAVIESETHDLGAHLTRDGDELRAEPRPKAEVRLTPSPDDLPDPLRKAVVEIAKKAQEDAVEGIAALLVDYQKKLDKEAGNLQAEEKSKRAEHADLIERNEANSEIEELTKSKRRQDELLTQIEAEEKRLRGLRDEGAAVASRIAAVIGEREAAISTLVEEFDSKRRERDPMLFGLEKAHDPDLIASIEERFNRNAKGPFMPAGGPLDLDRCTADPGAFMGALRSGAQRLKAGQAAEDVANEVFGAGPELRFMAEIDGDRIGGFKTSSMSPGKQALFALSLILDDSDEPWPLLIDQPEDDLDSRSISTQLVDYLVSRKSERQIIMVSHDANLVIGADAEQVIVANRHGANTKNEGGLTFDYFCGSLEHTRARRKIELELECGGIREHCCDILDGGEEAFRKRKRKYKID